MAPILQMKFREETPLTLVTQNETPAALISLKEENLTVPVRTSRARAAQG